LVRPIPQYSAACWDPYTEGQMNALYRIQKNAAPFTHHRKYSDWESVAKVRTLAQLCALLKLILRNGLRKLYVTGCHGLTIWIGLNTVEN